MQWVCFDGSFVPADRPLFTAGNRGFKWGDGVFETARFYNKALLLSPYHFERLFSGMQLLHITPRVMPAQLTDAIEALCKKNHCSDLARVRLAVYRNDENAASYVIEATALPPETLQWNESGWHIGLYPFARISCDAFANLKSANYLPYVMAGSYAKEQGLDECLVLNSYNRIGEGSKTNLFLCNGRDIATPALSEGCVAGVMRRYVIERLKELGYAVHQTAVTEEEVLAAEAVFLTNATEGLRWVRCFKDKEYGHGDLKKLYHLLFEPLYR
jgi:branched-chain amino acid aminotransferase